MRLCAKLISLVLVAKNMITDSGFYASGPNPFTGCCFRIPIIQTTIGWVSTLHGFHGRLIGSLVGPHIILTIVYTGKGIFSEIQHRTVYWETDCPLSDSIQLQLLPPVRHNFLPALRHIQPEPACPNRPAYRNADNRCCGKKDIRVV